VIDENSPAGTIEPAGSRVDLRVSARMVTVPDVTGESRITATAALQAAGLAVATVPVTSCVDPDVVTGQQPAGGTVVPQGSVITITIHICDGPPS
jgi:beta-lactam-binding protein with PASTA domain